MISHQPDQIVSILPNTPASRTTACTAAIIGGSIIGFVLLAQPVQAQTQVTLLRGSKASVERMYQQAQDHDLTFHETPKSIRDAVGDGRMEELKPNSDFTLHAVSYPYVLASTRVFVERLASQYHSACSKQLVVTSAVRPASRQPANSSANSVHPTGMAVDLRKPSGRCLTWLRKTLTELEKGGVLEVTEERHPVHFHVAIFPQPYASYLGGVEPARIASNEASSGDAKGTLQGTSQGATPSVHAANVRTVSTMRYRVRAGDTLSHLARRYGTTVKKLRSMNDLSSSRIRSGQTIIVPAAG